MIFEAIAVAALAFGASAQTSNGDAQTTINALAGGGLDASIVGVNNCATTIAVACDDESNFACAAALSLGITASVTFTQGPSTLELAYQTSVSGAQISIGETCTYQGPSPSFTKAVCTAIVSASADGVSTSSTITTSATTDLNPTPLPVTAGASKLPTGSAACSATGSTGAGPTLMPEVYKVLVPVGAVVVGAGMLL